MSTLSRLALFTLAGLPLVLGGCVAQEEYDDLHRQIDSLSNRNDVLRRERDQSLTDLNAARSQLALNENALAELRRINTELAGKLQAAGLSLADLERQISDINLTALDSDTDAALRALAAQYPDLITYDPARGMVRFNSDLTFDSGDDSVRAEARQSLGAFANILKGGPAAAYDVIIVGHTDAQRISARTAARHATNVHLSAHRAISVRRVLVDSGLPTDRFMVAGWGEFHPSVPNTESGNTPQNRRVEIFLTRMRFSGGNAAAPAEAPTEPVLIPAPPASGNTPPRPVDIQK